MDSYEFISHICNLLVNINVETIMQEWRRVIHDLRKIRCNFGGDKNKFVFVLE
jgi:hypothetical protein